jgi:hypothetical protein
LTRYAIVGVLCVRQSRQKTQFRTCPHRKKPPTQPSSRRGDEKERGSSGVWQPAGPRIQPTHGSPAPWHTYPRSHMVADLGRSTLVHGCLGTAARSRAHLALGFSTCSALPVAQLKLERSGQCCCTLDRWESRAPPSSPAPRRAGQEPLDPRSTQTTHQRIVRQTGSGLHPAKA